MLGLLGTLNLASRSLQTQMTGVEVTGQNLANVNTTGYTRQSVEIQTSPDISTVIGPEGTGANAVAIQQVVNAILNSQIQSQQSTSGYWNAQQTALQSAQTGLNEFLNGTGSATSSTSTNSTTDTGLSGQLSSLFADFQSVATSPTSVSARQQLVSDAQTLAATFNQVNTQLDASRTTLNTSLGNDVDSANKLISEIADLNKQISTANFSGATPNDLLDEREQDLENLSSLTNITASTGTNGAVDVSIGGQTLVSGNQVLDTLQTYDAGGGQLLVQTATGGVNLTLTGGSIQGTIDARDGELATMQSSINTLASTLITQVNTIHSGGFSLTGTTGANFFNGSDAATITVNATLANNPSLIQASGTVTATGDNSVALQLADLASATQSGLSNQTFSDSYGETVAALGDSLQTANDQVSNQTAVTNMLSTQRGSVSGVNVDEEMTNLMSFQRAYEASAQLVTTLNTMLGDTLAMKTS
ncbi:MAG TPA: flagellar hook-associated protein FlgK [Verrucomicrobiae bacterium]|jgi:flagellar hook-associated protein 1 FlgK|nr:flagellar hook-associated protein FlgK [Verrucomicrobiae bacterium]